MGTIDFIEVKIYANIPSRSTSWPSRTRTPLRRRLELAFVITGEPPAVPAFSTVSLMILGLLLLVGVTLAMRRMRNTRPA